MVLALSLVSNIVDYGNVACTPGSLEHVRRDLELTTVVLHCLKLVDVVGGEFAGTLVDVDVCHRTLDARAESHTHCC